STLININIDEAEVTRVQANTHPLHGDAKATIEALLPLLSSAGAGNRPSPEEAVAAARRLIAYQDIQLKEPHFPILETIQRSIPEDTHIVWDVTQFGYYARTHYPVHEPKTFIDSGYSFNLGFGFPTALGAKVAHPERPVISVNGDGGFLFNAVELATAVRYGINVTSIVFRDDAYGNVARDLEEFFDGDYETDLHNPDFVHFTESFGAVGMRADDPQDLKDLLPRALECEAPVVIDVPVGDLQLPRAEFMAVLPKLPWVRPQEGLIGS
ncbi:MAG: thiamine pyrophosphate-dependent enzyme, partial [Chloroflexota bacterium]|nr:thiamine pyrophosphate-dependent enzyme [Chloroflexota bacterium]